jgi:hypothetical protein
LDTTTIKKWSLDAKDYCTLKLFTPFWSVKFYLSLIILIQHVSTYADHYEGGNVGEAIKKIINFVASDEFYFDGKIDDNLLSDYRVYASLADTQNIDIIEETGDTKRFVNDLITLKMMEKTA